jgi:4-hydroxy-2-oxoglutarate aldolase
VTLAGVFPPITTPFDTDESIDFGALRANVDRWMATGLSGLVVLGSNGEAPFVDDDEAAAIVSEVRQRLPPGRLLIAGTGRESTRATTTATRRAAASGADVALVRTPGYYRGQMSAGVLVRHFETVAGESPIPILLYNFPAVTGVNLTPAAVERLGAHQNILGVKDSTGDLAQIAEIVDRSPARFQVLVGSAQTFYASLSVGACGGILALACVVPDLCVRLYDLTRTGHHDAARRLQSEVAPLARAVTSGHGVAGLKVAMDLVGYYGGLPRRPLGRPSPTAIEEIRQCVDALRPRLADPVR